MTFEDKRSKNKGFFTLVKFGQLLFWTFKFIFIVTANHDSQYHIESSFDLVWRMKYFITSQY